MTRSSTLLLLGTTMVLMTACVAPATDVMPQFMTVQEAFGPSGSDEPPKDSKAIKTNIFDASYEEVFRAASVSTSQAQFEIQSEDKHRGVILATREVQGSGYWFPRIFFYSIRLKELGPKRTKVTIVAKVQAACTRFNWGGASETNALCDKVSKGAWADLGGIFLAAPELSQFMIFVRNNLLAAGAL